MTGSDTTAVLGCGLTQVHTEPLSLTLMKALS